MKETFHNSTLDQSPSVILPTAMQQGDTIGLVAPSGPIIHQDNLDKGIQILKDAGYKLKFYRDFGNTEGYLAGSDQERADEFNSIWSDPEVKAVIAARGGYGSLRMLDMLDLEHVQKNPKILIGFSDLTVLLTAIHKITGMVTFHGPVVTTLASIDQTSRKSFFDALSGNILPSISPDRLTIVQNGQADGILLGGNLTTLAHLLATPYDTSWQDVILFIEDIGESPYRLDRLLTHLAKAQKLDNLSGLIIGTFTETDTTESPDLAKCICERILELVGDQDIPIWADFPVGHGSRNLTLPLGIRVQMDSTGRTLNLLDNCFA
jgi:muramoyltetrapeptide carboxypeptidase